jgi:hypothetical protein
VVVPGASMSEHVSVRFDYHDFGELADDLERVYLTEGTIPENVARGIAWEYNTTTGPQDLYAYIEEAAEEQDIVVNDVEGLRVHSVEAHPGGLMGIEYTYDIEALVEPYLGEPIILIGLYPRDMENLVFPTMERFPELSGLLKDLGAGNYEVYDMAQFPERGDALDAITEYTPLVVAIHIYGIDVEGDDHGGRDYFYNLRNEQLLPLTEELGVPLLAIGDQPLSHYDLPRAPSKVAQLYNMEDAG